MKTLVLFYSFEGNTRLMAEAIASETDADLQELRPSKNIAPRSFMKYFWGGKAVMMGQTPEIKPIEKHLEEYDLIFLGTPVWAFSYAPPLKTFFTNFELKDKKIALFCCHGGGKGRVFKKMRDELTGNSILGEIDFVEPLKKGVDSSTSRIRNWARDIINQITSAS